MRDHVPESPDARPRSARGRGPMRIIALAVVGALLIGLAGFTASVALTPDQPVAGTMCLDSGCNFAMSAGTSMSMSSGATTGGAQPARPAHRSAPARLVIRLLHLGHLR